MSFPSAWRLVLALFAAGTAACAAPSVTLVSPTMNEQYLEGVTVPVEAVVAAGTDVARVEFLANGAPIGGATEPPYRVDYPIGAALNHRFVARLTTRDGATVDSAPLTCVRYTQLDRQYLSYDYEEHVVDRQWQARLWMPADLETVRGLLIVSNPGGGDSRDWYRFVWYREFLHLNHFAFVGVQGSNSHADSIPPLLHAIDQWAEETGHPELRNAPFVATGFSSGGGYSSRLLVTLPERVIGVGIVSSRIKLTDVVVRPELLAVPGLVVGGELENLGQVVEVEVLNVYRPQGALYGWATVQGGEHTMGDQDGLVMPYLQAALDARYPADADPRRGPVALRPLAPDSGWLADHTTWASGLTTIAPAAGYPGDLRDTSWLVNQDVAYIYRAYATYDRPLRIVSPDPNWWENGGGRVWEPGSDATIVVDTTGFADWTKLEFYDGARLLGTVTSGAPQFTATALAPGYHALHVLGTNAAGQQRPSQPVLVTVRAANDT